MLKNICDRCKKTDCKYKNKPIENYTIFCGSNCALKFAQEVAAIKPELLKIVNTCENSAGLYGLYKQAADLLKVAEATQEPATDPDAAKLEKIADKITAIFAPWDIENATPAEIIEETRKNPLDAILFLLDYIENN